MKLKVNFFKKWDVILILTICISCVAVILLRSAVNTSAVAQIYIDGEITKEIDLTQVNESYTINVQGASVCVEKGRICYSEASCPDRLCVARGWLSKSGDVAACVPDKTVICIRGSSRSGIHAVTY